MNTIIKNVIVLTMDKEHRIYERGYVMIEQDRIISTGLMTDMPEINTEDIVIDGHGGILMPGMVNLHTHLGMIPFRGLGDDCRDRLRVFLLPMEQQAMDAELVYHSTAYAAAELLLAGTTCVFDMYYFEEQAAAAMEQSGIRGIAAETIMEENSCDFSSPQEALLYTRNMMHKYKDHPRIKACAAPHGTHTCSEAVLKAAHALDEEFQMPFSLHTAEMDYELEYFETNYNMTPIKYLDSIGVLDEHTLAAHCIHLSEADISLLSSRNAGVAHCIGSNTKAAKGVAPVKQLKEEQVSVGLGTDGPASGNTLDHFTQMKLFANFHKTSNHDRSIFPAEQIVEMATIGGAKALHMEASIGSIEIGKQADLILVETESVNMFPVYDPYSALVYSANASNVSLVYVAGECLVREKKLVKTGLAELRTKLSDKMRMTAFGEMKVL